MTPPMTATPAAPAAISFAEPRRIDAADRQDRHARGVRDLGQTLAADLRAVARLACGLESRTGQHIVDAGWIDRLGFGHGVDGNAQDLSGPISARAAAASRPDGRCTPSAPASLASAASPCSISFAAAAHARCGNSDRANRICSSARQIFFPQAHPSATGAQRRGDDSRNGRRACRRSVTRRSGGSGSLLVIVLPRCMRADAHVR